MSAFLDRFKAKGAPSIAKALGESWTHTNGDGVSRVYNAVFSDRFDAIGMDGALTEVTLPHIHVVTSLLADHAIGDLWTNSDGTEFEALTSEPQNRTGFTRITLRLS